MLLYVQRDVWEDYCAGKFESDTEKLVGMACDGMRWHGGEAPRHIEASTWEAGFDYLECSYMSKGMFRKIIVRGKLRVTRRSWNGWAWHGMGWHGGGVCQGTWKQVHGKLVLIVWNALICPKRHLGRLLCGEN